MWRFNLPRQCQKRVQKKVFIAHAHEAKLKVVSLFFGRGGTKDRYNENVPSTVWNQRHRVIFLTTTRAGGAAFRAQLVNVRRCEPQKNELYHTADLRSMTYSIALGTDDFRGDSGMILSAN